MQKKNSAAIEENFADLTDPRIDRTKLHKLLKILVIAICAVIAGADNWEDIAGVAQRYSSWSRGLPFPT